MGMENKQDVFPILKMTYFVYIFCFADDDRAIGETFNIGPDEETVTIIELAELISKLLNFKLDPVFLEDRPQEVKHATCSADKN